MKFLLQAFAIIASWFIAGTAFAATLELVPQNKTVQVGDSFTVEILLNTQGAEAEGVDVLNLNYNPELLEVQDMDANLAGVQILPGSLMSDTIINSTDSGMGKVAFSQAVLGGSTYNGNGVLASITFKAKAIGTANLSFDYTLGSTLDSNIASNGMDILNGVVNGSVLINEVSSSPSPAPTPTPPPPTPAPTPPSSSGGGGGGGGVVVSQTPFKGTAISLPGILQLEDFDNGGSGIAYNDTTVGNVSGNNTYRSSDVDLSPSKDTDGTFALGWTKAGEWLEYTVNITQTGNYDLDLRAASSGQGGTMHLELNGSNITGPMVLPNTGGWNTWVDVRKSPVYLPAGQAVLKVVFDSAALGEFLASLNYLNFKFIAPGADQSYISLSQCLINDKGTYYMVSNGKKMGIANIGLLYSHGYDFKDAVLASGVHSSLPAGELLSPGDGALVKKASDPTVYLVSEGKKYGFTSQEVFLTLGFRFSTVLIVTDPELDKVLFGGLISDSQKPHFSGVHINQDGAIFRIGNGQKHPYPSMVVYNSWNLDNSFSHVVPANSADRNLPTGTIISERALCK